MLLSLLSSIILSVAASIACGRGSWIKRLGASEPGEVSVGLRALRCEPGQVVAKRQRPGLVIMRTVG